MLAGGAASLSAASADEVALLLNPNSDGKFSSEYVVDVGEAGVSGEGARRRRGLSGVAGTLNMPCPAGALGGFATSPGPEFEGFECSTPHTFRRTKRNCQAAKPTNQKKGEVVPSPKVLAEGAVPSQAAASPLFPKEGELALNLPALGSI